MAKDPYESIIKECQITIYQEQKLRKSRFAFEPEQEEPSLPSPVQVTGIAMVSPPETGSEYVEEEIFHTPPEHHQARSVSGSDDPGPEIRPGSDQAGRKNVADDCVEDVIDLKRKKVDSQVRVRNDCLEETETIVFESDDDEIEGTEVVDLSVDESCVKLGERDVVEHVECETSRGRLGRKNIEDLDAFKYVPVRRQLPNSFKEPKENEGLWVPRRSLRDNLTFKGLVDAAGIVSGDDTDTDYMKVAKERGLTFPRPRWWPVDGFDDQVRN